MWTQRGVQSENQSYIPCLDCEQRYASCGFCLQVQRAQCADSAQISEKEIVNELLSSSCLKECKVTLGRLEEDEMKARMRKKERMNE